MRKVTCRCDTSFEADLPEEIDLDSEEARIDQILDGSFFSLTCPSCGAKLKPELGVKLLSRRRNLALQVIPEIDRLAFQLGQVAVAKGYEVLVGYAELYERARLLKDGLDPEAIEIIKYYLRLKAEEGAAEDSDIQVRYSGFQDEDKARKLAFHIAGMRADEIAVLPVSMDHYAKIVADKAKLRKTEPFDLVFKGPYKSLRVLEGPADQAG